jgi:hypothetical protein
VEIEELRIEDSGRSAVLKWPRGQIMSKWEKEKYTERGKKKRLTRRYVCLERSKSDLRIGEDWKEDHRVLIFVSQMGK